MNQGKNELVDWIFARYSTGLSSYRRSMLKRRLRSWSVGVLREMREDLEASDGFLKAKEADAVIEGRRQLIDQIMKRVEEIGLSESAVSEIRARIGKTSLPVLADIAGSTDERLAEFGRLCAALTGAA